MGEPGISSMTEPIKSPEALPRLGFRNFKRSESGTGGIVGMGMRCGGRKPQAPAWAEGVSQGLSLRGAGGTGLGGRFRRCY